MRAKLETKNTAIMRQVAAFGIPDNAHYREVRSAMIFSNGGAGPVLGSSMIGQHRQC